MKTKSPDISQIEVSKLKERTFNFNADFRISVSKEAYKFMHKHAAEVVDIELCGVLIGEVYKDSNGPYLEITNAIRGEYARNEGTQVAFTHETWDHIHKTKDVEFPDKQIVGWYHTHPRFGIFLSSNDVFIHENFFNQPWHTAYVIDPVSNEEGFFIWRDGKPFRIGMFWMSGELKIAPVTSDEVDTDGNKNDVEKHPAEKGSRKVRSLSYYGFALGMLLLTLLLFYIIIINNKSYTLLTQMHKYLSGYFSLNQPNQLSGKIINIQEIKSGLSNNPSLANLEIQLVQMNNHIQCYGEVSTYYQKELIGEIIKKSEGIELVDIQNIIVTHYYITQPGDNLNKIAEKLYGNSEMWIYIFNNNKNNLESPDMIKPNTKLCLPEVY